MLSPCPPSLRSVTVTGTNSFAWATLWIALVGLAGLLSNHLSAWVKLPAPILVFAAAAITARAAPSVRSLSEQNVTRLVTVALLCILFSGGMHIGWARVRSAAAPITIVGVVGTFATAAGAATFLHLVIGLDWYAALLVGTAVAPTDPAVVFAVLGKSEVAGLSGTILEGESGANDPVGIALMTALISAGGLSGGAFGHVAGEFLLQMGVGGGVGVVGGIALGWFMRRVPLPNAGLYPLRTLACALALYGVATLAHGSGFLAVFLAGIMIGDPAAPYKHEIEHFHSALASLGETVAFVVLGLTVDVGELGHANVWVPGVALGAVLAFVVRPALVGLCLTGSGLARNERGFVLFAGLKGAVPILLGSFLLSVRIPETQRLYGIVIVVVMFSVVVQGSLVPTAARLLAVPMRDVDTQPWAVGARLRDEPPAPQRFIIRTGSPADGATTGELAPQIWISLLIRAGQLIPTNTTTVLRAGDEVIITDGSRQSEKFF
jgi:cell volume regulation protein A